MRTRSIVWLVLLFILLVAGGIGLIRLLAGDEDTWLCENGQWVKHGQPSSPAPVVGCGDQPSGISLGAIPAVDETPTETATTTEPVEAPVRMDSPLPGGTVTTSPLEVSGSARGWWFFEASFPIELQDSDGNVLGSTIAQAQGEWMTDEFVPFTASLEFTLPETATGTLILKKDNPSGLPENEAEVHLPVSFQ